MNILSPLFFMLTVLMASISHAQDIQLELGCCSASQSVDSNIDIENSPYANLRGRIAFNDYWGAELALGGFNKAESETRRDNAGDYYLTFKSRELMAGLYGTLELSRRWNVSFSGGLLRYRTQVTLHESYLGQQPDQEIDMTEKGQGYYANIGVRWEYNRYLSLGPDLIYRQQQKLFSGSQRAFDLTTKGALMTLSLHF